MDCGEFAGHRKDRAFACCVGELWGCRAEEGDERGGVDYGTATGTAQGWNAIFAAQEDAFDIDGEGEVPDFFGGCDRVIVIGMRDASVVEHDIQLAVSILGCLDHGGAIGGFRDVGFDRDGAAARGVDERDDFFVGADVIVDGDDACALGGEQERGFSADAATGTSDEGYFVF